MNQQADGGSDQAHRMNALAAASLAEARRAWPYALVLAVALGAVIVAGANHSNATPSRDRPFGWPGPANFENAVAMVRGDLVIAATLPALLLGATALSRRDPPGGAPARIHAIIGVDALLVVAATLVAATIGVVGTFKTPPVAFQAFVVAHALLALSFYALAFFCAGVFRKHAVALALALWLTFDSLYEHVAQTAVMRQVGYDQLIAGNFPSWFFVAQAFSPMSAYRGILILWDRKFMDYVERAALGNAALPLWMVPSTFVVFTLAFWIVLPLALACLVRRVRARAASKSLVVRREEAA